MTKTNNTTSATKEEAARTIKRLGGNPIPLHPKSKSPVHNGWERLDIPDEDYATEFTEQRNIGTTLGPVPGSRAEGASAVGLYDFDADTTEAAFIANRFLPRTYTFERTSRPGAHRLVSIETPAEARITRLHYLDLDGKTMLLELRGEGHQTMMPPSIHPSGEPVTVAVDTLPAKLTPQQATERAGKIAAGAMLARLWPKLDGRRHVAALALAGALFRGGSTHDDVTTMMEAICAAGRDGDEDDRTNAVDSTAARIAAGETVTGLSELGRIVTEAGYDGRALKGKLRAWLNLKREVRGQHDTGNAERLIERHGANIRYCPALGWLVWDGTRWAVDDTDQIIELAKETAGSIYQEAADRAKQGDDGAATAARALSKWASTSLNQSRLTAMVENAKSVPEIVVRVDELDRNQWLLNVENGTVNLRTGGLEPHTRSDMLTKLAPVTYDARATCPMWLEMLDRILPDADTRAYVQRYIGFGLTGSVKEKDVLLAYGVGDNGKTTVIETLMRLLGDDYAMTTPESTIMAKRQGSEGIPNDIARLRGARLVVVSETTEGAKLNEGRIKAMTGRNKISARFMRGEWFDFWPVFKLMIETNHKPRVLGTDNAIWNRLRLVPFSVTIPKEEQDKALPDRLIGELSGILKWGVDGCLAWQEKGSLGAPEKVTDATSEYRESLDVLGDFLREQCVTGDPKKMRVQAGNLYAAFVIWAKQRGEFVRSQTIFGSAMVERGFVRKVVNGYPQYRGIDLRIRPSFSVDGLEDDNAGAA